MEETRGTPPSPVSTAAPELQIRFAYPPASLSPNARPASVYDRATAVKLYRRDCYIVAVDFRSKNPRFTYPLEGPLEADVVFEVLGINRRRDLDNLLARLKPLWDALIPARIIRDDNTKVIAKITGTVRTAPRTSVLITLRPLQ